LRPGQLRWPRLLTFLGIAYGGAWLAASPLWLGEGLRTPHVKVYVTAMMVTPALAGLVTALLWPDGRKLVDVLGLRPGPFRRWWWTLLVAWLGPPLLVGLSVELAAGLGLFRIDWGHWSTFRAVLPDRPLPMSLGLLLLLSVLSSVLVNPWLNAVFAAGEEIGWRGYLRDELSVLPRWGLILATGVIWGLWHAPVILLGYNYPTLPRYAGLAFMVIFTTLVAALLEWLRTVGTSVWPTALAHGSINSAANVPVLLAVAGHPPNAVTTGLLGWTGWLVMALVVLVLVLVGQLRLRVRPIDETPQSAGSRPLRASRR
jgi:membrane protease YdiL (CAAX protease family)